MKFSRKEFLSAVATGLAGAALKPSALLGMEPAAAEISPEMFLPLLDATFRVTAPWGGSTAELVLKTVTRKTDVKDSSQFSLEFVAPGGERLQERSYSNFEHPAFGKMPIFVTRTKTDAQGQTWYRADFNLLFARGTAQNDRKTTTVTGRPSR